MGVLRLKFYFYMFLYPIRWGIFISVKLERLFLFMFNRFKNVKVCSIILYVHCHWTCKNFEQKKGKQLNAFP